MLALACASRRVSWQSLVSISSATTIRSYHRVRPVVVHLLGAGSSGSLLAYHLQRAARLEGWPTGVTLQLRRQPDTGTVEEDGRVNIIVRDANLHELGRDRFAWQICDAPNRQNEPIDVLIVTTKADQTIEAISPLVHRLSKQKPATLVLVQNGVGMDEELTRSFGWHDDPHAPFIIRGVSSNGSWSKKRFDTVHSKGTLQIALSALTAEKLGDGRARAILPASDDEPSHDLDTQSLISILHLLRTKSLHEALGTSFYVNQLAFDVVQQRKLVVNCVANPLTALYELQNGQMPTHSVVRAKAEEIIVECAYILEQVYRAKGIDTPEDLQLDALRSFVWYVIDLTRDNYSSTVQDIWSARGSTEIDFFNGTMVRWADSLNVPAPHNADMAKRVHEKARQAYLTCRQQVAHISS